MLNYYWNNEKIIKKISNKKLNIFDNSCKNVIDKLLMKQLKNNFGRSFKEFKIDEKKFIGKDYYSRNKVCFVY